VKQEEIKIKEKIRFLEGEIATWENNIEFFARSKNAEKLKQEIQSKIDKSNGQIDRLKKELKEIKSLATEKV
jgi:superoxide dismutase